MKKRILTSLLLVCLLSFMHSFAQNKQNFLKVDYADIENFVIKQEKEYNALVERFATGDTTLTMDDIKRVYYGSYYSPKYNYSNPSEELRKAFNAEQYQKALNLSKKELEESPAHIELLFDAWASAKQVDEEESYLYQLRLSQILDMVLSTGDGKSSKTAIKILEVSDEYFILYGVMGVRLKQQALSGNCDIMTVYEDDPDETFDVYFDITLHMKKLNDLFGGKKASPKKQKNKNRGK